MARCRRQRGPDHGRQPRPTPHPLDNVGSSSSTTRRQQLGGATDLLGRERSGRLGRRFPVTALRINCTAANTINPANSHAACCWGIACEPNDATSAAGADQPGPHSDRGGGLADRTVVTEAVAAVMSTTSRLVPRAVVRSTPPAVPGPGSARCRRRYRAAPRVDRPRHRRQAAATTVRCPKPPRPGTQAGPAGRPRYQKQGRETQLKGGTGTYVSRRTPS